MGIDKQKIFNFGCPSLDLLLEINFKKKLLNSIMRIGVGNDINFEKNI